MVFTFEVILLRFTNSPAVTKTTTPVLKKEVIAVVQA